MWKHLMNESNMAEEQSPIRNISRLIATITGASWDMPLFYSDQNEAHARMKLGVLSLFGRQLLECIENGMIEKSGC